MGSQVATVEGICSSIMSVNPKAPRVRVNLPKNDGRVTTLTPSSERDIHERAENTRKHRTRGDGDNERDGNRPQKRVRYRHEERRENRCSNRLDIGKQFSVNATV